MVALCSVIGFATAPIQIVKSGWGVKGGVRIKDEKELAKMGLEVDKDDPSKFIPIGKVLANVCPDCGGELTTHLVCKKCGRGLPKEQRELLKQVGKQMGGHLPKRGDGGDTRIGCHNHTAAPGDRPNTTRTPDGVCQFIHNVIVPHYENIKRILDPCCGDGALTAPWQGREVIWCEIEKGTTFFDLHQSLDVDLVLCNPPFCGDRKKSLITQFLEHIFKVVGTETPIVLVVGWSFRMGLSTTSTRLQWLRDKCPPITTIISLPQNVWDVPPGWPKPSCLYAEILLFNMPKLHPHYFLPDRYLIPKLHLTLVDSPSISVPPEIC